jgi:hypothetical protein
MAGSPNEDFTSIGSVLLRLGYITESDLWMALRKQARVGDVMLGAILVEMGIIGPEAVAKAAGLQRMMRDGNVAMAELDVVSERIGESAELSAKTRRAVESIRGRKKRLTLVGASG